MTKESRYVHYYNAVEHIGRWAATGKIPRSPTLHCLLGYASSRDCYNNMTEDNVNTCLKLMGPHGLTIYKMLLARRKDK